jgi:hypothetical protein
MKTISKCFLIISLIVCGTSFFYSCYEGPLGGEHNTDPAIKTDRATNITDRSATLNGTVTASSVSQTVSFLYCVGTTWSQETSVMASPPQVVGTGQIKFSANVWGLSSGQLYSFKAVSVNLYGRIEGKESMFETK